MSRSDTSDEPICQSIYGRDVATLPQTSLDCYLSGMAALNLPSENGTGDWHLAGTFFRPQQKLSRTFIAGPGCATDTSELLGSAGIYECSSILDRLKIPRSPGNAYAATHARAIADLVLGAVLRGGSPDFVRLDDWMPTQQDKQEVFALIDIALPKLTFDQTKKVTEWLRKNAK